LADGGLFLEGGSQGLLDGGWNKARGVPTGVRAGGGGQIDIGETKMSQNISGGGGRGIVGIAVLAKGEGKSGECASKTGEF